MQNQIIIIESPNKREKIEKITGARVYATRGHFKTLAKDFLKEYEAENKMDNDEYLLFLIKLAIPKRIEFTKNTYLDCYHINNYLVYLRKIAFLVQKLERIPEKV